MAPSPPQDTNLLLLLTQHWPSFFFSAFHLFSLQSNANLVDMSGSFASLATVRGFINIVVRSGIQRTHTNRAPYCRATIPYFDESSCPFRVTDLPVRQLSRFKPCPGQSPQTAFFPGLLITLILTFLINGFRIIRGWRSCQPSTLYSPLGLLAYRLKTKKKKKKKTKKKKLTSLTIKGQPAVGERQWVSKAADHLRRHSNDGKYLISTYSAFFLRSWINYSEY